jgi:hypothetical protein
VSTHWPWCSALEALAVCLALVASCGPSFAQPTNDNFASRGSLPSTNITVYGSLAGASLEAGEPVLPEVSSGQTAWWTWTAPANGIVTLSAAGTDFSPLLAVYLGSDLLNLWLVASNNYVSQYEWCAGNTTCHWQVRDQATFHVTQGQAYQVAVDSAIMTSARVTYSWGLPGLWSTNQQVLWSTNVPAGADYRLGLQFTAAPTNDDFAHATWVHGPRLRLSASNAGATSEPGEFEHLGNTGGSSVWYAWTAPASGRVTLSVEPMPVYAPPSSFGDGLGLSQIIQIIGTGPLPCTVESPLLPLPRFFPVFSAYTGSSVGALTSAGCLPLALTGYDHAVAFDTVKGETYHLAFDGNQGTTGSTPLCLALTKPAVNDAFEHRLALHGIYVIARGYNAGATPQEGEPAAAPGSTGKTVWWSWTAPVSGTVSLDLSGSDYAFPVAVFTGATLGDLSLVATNSGTLSFTATAGQTYQIAVSDLEGLTGAINLVLSAPIVGLDLYGMKSHSPRLALLSYNAIAGQKVLLERSSDGSNWQRVRTTVAHRALLHFLVHPAPSASGPYYRAIILDRSFR